MVGLGRLELPTSRLSSARSNQTELQARSKLEYPTAKRLSSVCSSLPSDCCLLFRGKGCVGGAITTRLVCKVKTQNSWRTLPEFQVFLRKEVIQPQVPLRLPCYDFTPVADLTVVGCSP